MGLPVGKHIVPYSPLSVNDELTWDNGTLSISLSTPPPPSSSYCCSCSLSHLQLLPSKHGLDSLSLSKAPSRKSLGLAPSPLSKRKVFCFWICLASFFLSLHAVTQPYRVAAVSRTPDPFQMRTVLININSIRTYISIASLNTEGGTSFSNRNRVEGEDDTVTIKLKWKQVAHYLIFLCQVK